MLLIDSLQKGKGAFGNPLLQVDNGVHAVKVASLDL